MVAAAREARAELARGGEPSMGQVHAADVAAGVGYQRAEEAYHKQCC